jgi:hypothetical protein
MVHEGHMRGQSAHKRGIEERVKCIVSAGQCREHKGLCSQAGTAYGECRLA